MADASPTVFIVDDDPAMLDALRTMAETVRLSAEAYSSAEELFERCDFERAGCLVLDVRMPGMSGLQALDVLISRGVEMPVIMLTGHGDVPSAVRAVKRGAFDFLEKPPRQQDLLDRIYAAFQVDAGRRRRKGRSRESISRYETLTPRERQAMQLIVAGRTVKQAAAELGISSKTMEKFRAKVMRKMAAGSVAELVVMAVSLGLVSPDEGAQSP